MGNGSWLIFTGAIAGKKKLDPVRLQKGLGILALLPVFLMGFRSSFLTDHARTGPTTGGWLAISLFTLLFLGAVIAWVRWVPTKVSIVVGIVTWAALFCWH